MGDPVLLSRVPAGHQCRITGVDPSVRAELSREGLLPGTRLTVTTHTPLGGPIVVDLGRSRIALSAAVADRIEISALDDAEPAEPRS